MVHPKKLEHGFGMIRAGIPYTSPSGYEDSDVPTFWLLLDEVFKTETPNLYAFVQGVGPFGFTAANIQKP